MTGDAWSVAQAKAKFSEVIENARMHGPQHITRNGKEAVVVVSVEEWRRRSAPARSLVEILTDSSARGLLEPGESSLFERDRTDDRPPPTL